MRFAEDIFWVGENDPKSLVEGNAWKIMKLVPDCTFSSPVCPRNQLHKTENGNFNEKSKNKVNSDIYVDATSSNTSLLRNKLTNQCSRNIRNNRITFVPIAYAKCVYIFLFLQQKLFMKNINFSSTPRKIVHPAIVDNSIFFVNVQ